MIFRDNNTNDSIIHRHFTPSGGLILLMLIFAVLALGERVMYDLARLGVGSTDYFGDLNVILIQAALAVVLLVISIYVSMTAESKSERYAILFIPYFITSVILTAQVILQVAIYFASHHTNLQFYLVMALFSAITTYGIYWVQTGFGLPKEQTNTPERRSHLYMLIAAAVAFLVLLFVILFLNSRSDQLLPNENSLYPQTPINRPVPTYTNPAYNTPVYNYNTPDYTQPTPVPTFFDPTSTNQTWTYYNNSKLKYSLSYPASLPPKVDPYKPATGTQTVSFAPNPNGLIPILLTNDPNIYRHTTLQQYDANTSYAPAPLSKKYITVNGQQVLQYYFADKNEITIFMAGSPDYQVFSMTLFDPAYKNIYDMMVNSMTY